MCFLRIFWVSGKACPMDEAALTICTLIDLVVLAYGRHGPCLGSCKRTLSHDKETMIKSLDFCPNDLTLPANLWQIVEPLVEGQSENAGIVMDDSIAHKPHTDQSELIGWHYDQPPQAQASKATFSPRSIAP